MFCNSPEVMMHARQVLIKTRDISHGKYVDFEGWEDGEDWHIEKET